jgi:hypothetical protein
MAYRCKNCAMVIVREKDSLLQKASDAARRGDVETARHLYEIGVAENIQRQDCLDALKSARLK